MRTTKDNVHFVLDEAASLGHLSCIDDAVGMGRGYGIRLQFYFQSLSQTQKNFPEGQEQTLLSNTTQIFFAVNDQQTAELVSSRLGERTIVVDSGGTNSGNSRGSSSGGRDCSSNSGVNAGASQNWQQQARRLLKPEEVIALPPRVAITFTPGLPPIATHLVRYYEKDFCPGRLRQFRAALRSLIVAAVLCALSLMIAATLTETLLRAWPSIQAARSQNP